MRLFYQKSQGKGTLFRNIQNAGRWYYSALGSRPAFWITFVSLQHQNRNLEGYRFKCKNKSDSDLVLQMQLISI